MKYAVKYLSTIAGLLLSTTFIHPIYIRKEHPTEINLISCYINGVKVRTTKDDCKTWENRIYLLET
jgi:hypothetical protein